MAFLFLTNMFISVSSQTSLITPANNFVFALYDASAPSVLLESQAPVKPYANPIQISFTYNCLPGHIYIIKLWESADTTPTGVVRNSFSQSVNSNSVSVRTTEYLEAGITAGLTPGLSSYVDITLAGWDYWLVRNPNTMIPDSSSNTEPNYHQVVTGGFNLIQSGDTFQPNEKFEIHFIPQVIAAPLGSPSSLFSSGQIITADKVLTGSDSAQALYAQSATTTLQITLPPLVSISDYTFFYIYSNGGQQKNVVIPAQGSDKIQYEVIAGTNQVNQIIIGKNELIKLYKANGVWNVENTLPGVQNIGELIFNFLYAPVNSLPCDGTTRLRADYPRLWNFIATLSSAVVTDSAWNSTFVNVDGINFYTNKGCFSAGDGSTTFRLPLLTGMVLKGADTSVRMPGSLEMDTMPNHEHEQTIGTLPTSVFGEGQVIRRLGNYNDQSNTKTDLTGPPTDANGNNLIRVGTENLIRTIGAYYLIRC